MRFKTAWFAIFWANWIILFLFWWIGSGGDLLYGGGSTLVAFGRLLGLMATYMILIQFFTMGRAPFLERVFGLDRLTRIHHQNGKWGMLALLCHPPLLILGYARNAGSTIAQEAKDVFLMPHIIPAGAGLLLFIVVVASSIVIVRRKLRYETWYVVHLLAYLAVFLSLGHQFSLGKDLLSNTLFYGYWVLLYVAVFSFHAVFRFGRPLYLFARHRFSVQRITQENYNTYSVVITGRAMDRFLVRPGQFLIVRFFARGSWWQAHPFSLSAVPDGTCIRVTIKALGDFTHTVKDIPPGTSVLIDGPYGIFTDGPRVQKKVLCIAGGIGITPIRSLMEGMSREGKDVVLLYANKTAKDIVFQQELQDVAARLRASIIHIVSDDPNFSGEQGTLDGPRIQALVPDTPEREVFLCGPVPMMRAIVPALVALGVSSKRIHTEQFSL